MDARAQTRGFERAGGTLRQIPSVDELLLQPRLADFRIAWTAAWLWKWRARYWRISRAARRRYRIGPRSRQPGLVEELITAAVERISRDRCSRNQRHGVFSIPTWAARRCRKPWWKNFAGRPRSIRIWNTIWRRARAGKRDVHTAELSYAPTGAESAIVVNNCAAAILVVSRHLRARRSDRFARRAHRDRRRLSNPGNHGAERRALREVGTTNRQDRGLRNAINEKTRLLLRVHPSNFTVTGFTDKPSLEDLVG